MIVMAIEKWLLAKYLQWMETHRQIHQYHHELTAVSSNLNTQEGRDFPTEASPFQQTYNQGSTCPMNSHSLANQRGVQAP